MAATWDAAISDPDPLAALAATRALQPLLAAWEARLVTEATASGATWETVGATIGVSRQAAWARFHDDESKEFRTRVKTELHDLRDRHRHEMAQLVHQVKDEAYSRGGRGRKR